MSSKRDRSLLILAIIALIGFLLSTHWQMFFGKVMVGGDMIDQNLPVRFFYQKALHSGDSFLWTPDFFCGYYIHAEGQGGFFHPFHYLLYRFLPLEWGYNLETFCAYTFLFIGMYGLLRRFLFPNFASAFGALSFTFCGFTLLHYGHVNAIEVISHLPWLLAFIYDLFTTQSRRRFLVAAIGMPLVLASQLLLGYPFYVVLSFLVVLPFAVWLSLRVRSRWKLDLSPHSTGEGVDGQITVRFSLLAQRRVAVVTMALICGILIGAVQWQPTRDLLKQSARKQTDFNFRMSFSSHPGHLLGLSSPNLLKNHTIETPYVGSQVEENPYNGIVAMICLSWAVARFRHWGRWRRLLTGAGILGAIACVLSFGYFGYLYRLVALLPGFTNFRCPGRYVLLFHFAWAFFVAFSVWDIEGIARKVRPAPTQREWLGLLFPLCLSLFGTLLVILVGAGIVTHPGVRANLSHLGDALYGVGLTSIATVLFFLWLRAWRIGVVLLAAFLLFDLVTYWGPQYRAIPSMTIAEYGATLPPAPAIGAGRLMTDEWKINVLLRGDGYRLANGYAGLFPARMLPLQAGEYGPGYRDENYQTTLRLAGVEYARPRFRYDRPDLTRWLPVKDTMPRARLVSRAFVSENPVEDIGKIDIAETALVDKAVSVEEGPRGTVRIVSERNTERELSVETPTRQLLVYAEAFHPGWMVTIDDRPAEIVRAYGDFMGFEVPPGQHHVRLSFRPRSFMTGIKLTLIGVAALLCYVIGIGSGFRHARIGRLLGWSDLLPHRSHSLVVGSLANEHDSYSTVSEEGESGADDGGH